MKLPLHFFGCKLSAIKLRSGGISWSILFPEDPAPQGLDGQEFAALMVPVREGRGLIRWAMVSGMVMVRGEIWACTCFTRDSPPPASPCFHRTGQ